MQTKMVKVLQELRASNWKVIEKATFWPHLRAACFNYFIYVFLHCRQAHEFSLAFFKWKL